MGPIFCPETSVRKYNYSLRNNPEQRSSQILRGVNLKYRNCTRISTKHRKARKLVDTRHVKQKQPVVLFGAESDIFMKYLGDERP
jgi:hypothetical protein